MKVILVSALLACSTILFAQKNVVPVTASAVTGITLPDGSKKDSRFMSTAGAEILLSLEGDKVKATLSGTEVLMLPASSASGFNKESLTEKLKAEGWSIVPVPDDNKFSWLYKDKRTVIAYFSDDTKSTSLYFSNATLPVAQKTETAEPKPVAAAPVVSTPATSSTLQPINPSTSSTPTTSTTPSTPSVPAASSTLQPLNSSTSSYAFTSTNFDDGWTGTVKEDWVIVVKGKITVLLHYPTSAIDVSSYDHKTISANAWNTLVSGRYSNLQNFSVFPGTIGYERPSFISGDVTENSTGNNVHVVLFNKGNSGWIEIITPDRNSFIQSFGIDISKVDYYADDSIWVPLIKLAWYNRFAVSQSDITGKWTNKYSGSLQYVNAYTGANAGMNTHSSSQTFEFEANGKYKWEISVASGFVGNIQFQNAKSAGVATHPNNWQIHFSDLEGKPKTYNAYFTCIKGARILMLEDTSYPTGYTGYGKM